MADAECLINAGATALVFVSIVSMLTSSFTQALRREELMKLYGYFEVAEYEPGHSIFHQGDDINSMLLIQRGSCVCTFEGDPAGERDRATCTKESGLLPDADVEPPSGLDVLLRRMRKPISRVKVQLAVLGSGQIIGAHGPVLGIHRGICNVTAVDSVRAFVMTAERLKTLQHELSWSLNLRETIRIWGEEANLFQKWVVKAIRSNPRISIPSDFRSIALGQGEKSGETAGSAVPADPQGVLDDKRKVADGQKALQRRNETMRAMAAKHDKWTRATFIDYSLSTKRGHVRLERLEVEQVGATKPCRKMRAGRVLLPGPRSPSTTGHSVSFADSSDTSFRTAVHATSARFSLSAGSDASAIDGLWSISDWASQGTLDVGQRAKALAVAYAPPDAFLRGFLRSPEVRGTESSDIESIPIPSDAPKAAMDSAASPSDSCNPKLTEVLLQSEATSPAGDWLISERNVHAQWHTTHICHASAPFPVLAGPAPPTEHVAATRLLPDDRWRRPASTELIGRSCTTISAPTRGLLDSRGLRSEKGFRSSNVASGRVPVMGPMDTCRLARPATTDNAVRRLYPSSSRDYTLATCSLNSKKSGKPWRRRDPRIGSAHLSGMLSPERTVASPCSDELLSAPAGHVQWQKFRPKAAPQPSKPLTAQVHALLAEMPPIHKMV